MTISARNSIASVKYIIPARNLLSGVFFSITFPFLNNEKYVSVWYRNIESAKKDLIMDTDYSLELTDGKNNIYGRIVILKDIEEVESITIERKIENDQDVNFTSDTLYSSTTEYALDKLTSLVQDMNFKNYTLRAPSDEKLENSESYELPSKEERVNKILGFGEDGLPRIYDRVEGGVIYPATKTSLGTIMVGSTLEVNDVGKIEVPYAGEARSGIIKVGEGFILAEEGKISVDQTGINEAKSIADDAKTNAIDAKIIAQNSFTNSQKSLENIINVEGKCRQALDKVVNFSNSGWPYSDFPDVENWSFFTFPNSMYSYYVFYDGNKFIALGYNTNKTAYSYDGINWTESTLPVSANWRCVLWRREVCGSDMGYKYSSIQ